MKKTFCDVCEDDTHGAAFDLEISDGENAELEPVRKRIDICHTCLAKIPDLKTELGIYEIRKLGNHSAQQRSDSEV